MDWWSYLTKQVIGAPCIFLSQIHNRHILMCVRRTESNENLEMEMSSSLERVALPNVSGIDSAVFFSGSMPKRIGMIARRTVDPSVFVQSKKHALNASKSSNHAPNARRTNAKATSRNNTRAASMHKMQA